VDRIEGKAAFHWIRVNTVHPTNVATQMVLNKATFKLFMPDAEHPTRDEAAEVFQGTNALPTPSVEPVDISNGMLFLASDEARYVRRTELKVDAGFTVK
jgi:NAD(P)-dependent dehydrogenase (short-subunit alcohol dehydrogenase family)